MQQSNPTPALPAEQPSTPIQVCLRPDCGKKLQSHNTIGYCRRHRGDAKLVPQVCKRVGCSTRLTIRSKTGYCELHKSDANTGKPPLTEDELKEHQADDRWEGHHGETDTIACRICGKRMQVLGSKKKNHLLEEHGRTVREYHQYCQSRGWGTPQLSSLKTQKAITEWKDKHPEKVEGYRLARLAKRKLLRRADPNFGKRDGAQIRERAQRKLTPADKEVRVQCQVPDQISGLPCGEWYRGLGKHLWSVHHMSLAAYNILRPGAPTEAPDLIGQGSKVGQINKRWWAEQKQKLAEAELLAWHPDDWDKAEQLDRTVGFLLLSDRHIKNLEIGALLDEMGWKCPYEKTWKSALSRPGSAANYITDIRKWVKVPGKTIAPKPRSITH
jgi:predicted transcriptional regulator